MAQLLRQNTMVNIHNASSNEGIPSLSPMISSNSSMILPRIENTAEPTSMSLAWSTQLTVISLLSVLLLSKRIPTAWRQQRPMASAQKCKDPPQVPYSVPVIGNLISYLSDASKLALLITQKFGSSSIVRLSFLTKDIYVVSGAEYLNSIFKNTKGLTSTNGINIALHNMFDTPKRDMAFFEADKSGITQDPHPKSSTKPEDRVFYLMHKATVDCLAGSHLTIAAQRFQVALERRIVAVPVQEEWMEMDDLFSFLLPLISYSTIEAMCGATFLQMFPEFVDNFWHFNTQMPKLLQGWPRWMMPKAWSARDRCISIMKKWRQICDTENFDGNAMMVRRWSYFSKMQGLSEHGVACSDLGILWGMNSNSMPATFWLFWHMMRDRSLLSRAIAETDGCRTSNTNQSPSFDTTKLCNQPLLQSSYAETLRMYVAVYLIRKPEYEDAQVLDYRIPKDKMIVISSAMAHMNKANWNLGAMEEYPVERFWAERFLTYGGESRSRPSVSRVSSTSSNSSTTSASSIDTNSHPSAPKFSLDGYRGAWVPFGGGIHQCPGRHWVKLQMLLSFAMISAAFDIEIVGNQEKLSVDMAKYGLGALQPAEKVAFRIRRKRSLS